MALGTILGQTSSGKRVCRLVVGTSTSGWTTSDCDYLCDGTADDVEINAAIQALPSTGGEIVILDGTYNITATIAMNKDNTKLSGNGAATILKRMWDSSTLSEAVININTANGGCCVENLQIDGNKATYSSTSNINIYLSNSDNNTITGNICNNSGDAGICLNESSNNVVTGNTCNNNDYGIYLRDTAVDNGYNNTVTGNTCDNNSSDGINMYSIRNSTITGNTCNNNDHGIYLLSSDDNVVAGNTCNNNNNYGIFPSGCDNSTITGNTCDDNSDGIRLNGSNNNTVTGNTCNNNSSNGIRLMSGDNNTIVGNTCIRGTGQSSDYASSQYTIRLYDTYNNYNLIANNNIMGKNYVSGGGTSNTFVNNKFE